MVRVLDHSPCDSAGAEWFGECGGSGKGPTDEAERPRRGWGRTPHPGNQAMDGLFAGPAESGERPERAALPKPLSAKPPPPPWGKMPTTPRDWFSRKVYFFCGGLVRLIYNYFHGKIKRGQNGPKKDKIRLFRQLFSSPPPG